LEIKKPGAVALSRTKNKKSLEYFDFPGGGYFVFVSSIIESQVI
jgi:hypothetical protein